MDDGGDQRDPILHRERPRCRPDRAARGGPRPAASRDCPVREVGEAVVGAHPGRDPGQPGDLVESRPSAATVRGARSAAPPVVGALDLDAVDPASIGEQSDDRLTEEGLHAGRLGREFAQESDRGDGG